MKIYRLIYWHVCGFSYHPYFSLALFNYVNNFFGRAPEIDISELESLFSAAVPTPDQNGSGRKAGSRGSMGQKPEKVQLVIYCDFACNKYVIKFITLSWNL